MDTLSDIDPLIVENVLANADAYMEAQRRIEQVIKDSEQKVAKVEQHLARQLSAGVSEETAADEYSAECHRIRNETEVILRELTKEYEEKYPALAVVE